MRSAARPAVEHLSSRKILVADAAAVVVRLRNSGLDVGPGSHDVRFDASVAAGSVDRSPARKADDIVGAIRAGIGDSTAVGAGLTNVLAGSDRDHVFGRPGRADRIGGRTAV